MKVNLNKRLLLFLAVFMVLVLIPTSFAADAADGDVVGIDDDSAIDTISESAVSDDVSSDNGDSAVSAINDDIISADGDDEGDEGDDVEPDDNIYVDASAAAGGNGSKEKPFQTVSQAYNNATDGKTIVINPGTYTIGTSNARMTVNKNLTFTGVGEVKFKAASGNGFINIDRYATHVAFNNIQFVDSRLTTGTLITTYHEMFYVTFTSTSTQHDIKINNCVIKNITASSIIGRETSWSSYDVINATLNGSILMNNTFNSNMFTVTRGTVNNNFWGSNSKPTGLGNAVTINNWIVVRADITDEEKTIGNTYPVSLELKSYNGTEDSELEDNFQEFDLTLSAVVNAIEPNFVKISENKAAFDYVVAEGGAETISYVNGRNTVPLLTFTIPKVLFEIEKINEGEKLRLSIHASKSTSNVTVRVDDKDYVIPLTDGEAVEEIETNLVPGTYTVTVFIRNNPEASKVIEIDYRNVEFAFDITDTEINKQASIKIIPSIESFKEDIIVFVNDKKYTATKAEDYTIVTDPLAAGYYNVIALFYGDAYHNEASNTTSFNVAKLTTEIAITLPPSIKIGDDVEVAITSYDGADIKVTVNGEEKTLTDGKLTIPNVAAGTYVITATVDETAVQEGATKTESFNLFKDDASITASGTNAVAGEPSTVTVTVTDALTGDEITAGTVIVKVNEMEYGIDLSKGNTVQVIINAAGTYDVTARFLGNDAFKEAETTEAAQITITDPEKVDPVINIPTDIVAGEDATIEIDIPGATGSISVIVDGVETSIPLEDGKASITLDKLSSGDHSVVVLYDGDGNIAGVHTAAVISVPAADVGNKTKIDIPTDIKAGEDTPINIDIPGATGNVSVIVDGKETVIPLVDGKASYTLSNMSEGDHSFVLIYPGDGTIGPIHSATSFNVAPSENGTDNKTGARTNTTISSKALTISTYVKAVNGKNTRYFTVTLKDEAGNALANKTIQFVFNGKITKVTTDKNGKAKVLIGTATKGTYYMTASFLGDDDYNACVATQKVKINPQKTKIVAKKKTFKRSKKVKKYTVTLKAANGKAIKGKKIVLTINKKKYTKKTNKKGKAVFKLKKLSRKKTYKAKIKFAGDNYFKKSSKTVKIKIK